MSSRALISYRDIPGPATSNEVGGLADIIKSEITMSLALLKEASSLASKLPCISVIAGMLLYYIQMHDDIRLCKAEWMVVAQKLVDVASLVISVGKSCEMLGKKDLVPLQGDLQHLQRDLEGIGGVLKECAGTSRIKKAFMRGDILLKIKHCDSMLSHAISMFQTKMSLRIYYTQLIQGREVHTGRAVAVTPSAKVARSSRKVASSSVKVASSPMVTTKTIVGGGIVLSFLLLLWRALWPYGKRK